MKRSPVLGAIVAMVFVLEGCSTVLGLSDGDYGESDAAPQPSGAAVPQSSGAKDATPEASTLDSGVTAIDAGAGDGGAPVIPCGASTCSASVGCFGGICGNVPVQIASDADGLTTCAVLANERLYCWGASDKGQVGTGAVTNSGGVTPARLLAIDSAGKSFEGIVQVSVATQHACALKRDRSLYCWGTDDGGELGVPGQSLSTLPEAVPSASGPAAKAAGIGSLVSVVVGGPRSCLVDDQGQVFCWGSNWESGLGHGPFTHGDFDCANTSCSTVPVKVAGLGVVTSLALGAYFACATDEQGVACWGSNNEAPGELGTNALAAGATESATPVRLQIAGATHVGAGRHFACAWPNANGAATCWGSNGGGQLAQGVITNPLAPTPFDDSSAVTNVTSYAGGLATSAVLTSDGSVFTAGYNGDGELGIGTNAGTAACDGYSIQGTLCNPTAQKVMTSSGVPLKAKAITSGRNHVCAIGTDDAVYCWGDNAYGQLGDGTLTSSSWPVRVKGLP